MARDQVVIKIFGPTGSGKTIIAEYLKRGLLAAGFPPALIEHESDTPLPEGGPKNMEEWLQVLAKKCPNISIEEIQTRRGWPIK